MATQPFQSGNRTTQRVWRRQIEDNLVPCAPTKKTGLRVISHVNPGLIGYIRQNTRLQPPARQMYEVFLSVRNIEYVVWFGLRLFQEMCQIGYRSSLKFEILWGCIPIYPCLKRVFGFLYSYLSTPMHILVCVRLCVCVQRRKE